MYVSLRRSGVPTFENCCLLCLLTVGIYPLARRFNVNEPLKSDKMYRIILDSYKSQGYTMSTNDVKVLNQERVWYDKDALQFGHGLTYRVFSRLAGWVSSGRLELTLSSG